MTLSDGADTLPDNTGMPCGVPAGSVRCLEHAEKHRRRIISILQGGEKVMRKFVAVLVACGLATQVLAAAPTTMAGIQKGEKEISGSVSVMSGSGGDADVGTTWMLIGSGGYFITDNIQVKGTGLIFGNSGNDMSMVNGSVGAGADYLFDAGLAVIPYVGGDLLISFSKVSSDSDLGGGDTSDTSLGFDIHAGVKQFIADHTAINYELRYMMDTSDSGTKWLILTVGINFYLQ
ncbi:MAG: hypothetical protein C0404_03940 [Verrucomicrobia bacterium]|nr:hypothetical protein [Verrucomicrobiota bacterium]